MRLKLFRHICLFFFVLTVTISRAQSEHLDDPVSISMLKIRYGDIEVLDLNGDGRDDLIISGVLQGWSNSTQSYIQGTSGFSLMQSSGLPYIGFSSLSSGDVDGDGDVDVFAIGSWSSAYAAVYLNDGTGHLSEMNQYFVNGAAAGDCELFDADNDGDLDVLYFGQSPARITKLMFNDGNGVFTDANQVFEGFEAGNIDVADYNKDGYQDFLISGQTNNSSGKTILWKNNGDGTFVESGDTLEGVCFGNARFIDLEGDDDLDIVVNGLKNGVNTVHSVFYINDNGTYIDAGNRGLDSLKFNSIEMSDVDLDGDDDIFLSGRTDQGIDTCGLFINNNGFFSRDTAFVAQGLFDGDAVFIRTDHECAEDLIYCGFGDVCLNEIYLAKNRHQYDPCPVEPVPVIPPVPTEPVFHVQNNPFTTIIRVSVQATVTEAKVYDERGRLVYESHPMGGSILIDLQDESDAVYYLEFSSEGYSDKSRVKLLKVGE